MMVINGDKGTREIREVRKAAKDTTPTKDINNVVPEETQKVAAPTTITETKKAEPPITATTKMKPAPRTQDKEPEYGTVDWISFKVHRAETDLREVALFIWNKALELGVSFDDVIDQYKEEGADICRSRSTLYRQLKKLPEYCQYQEQRKLNPSPDALRMRETRNKRKAEGGGQRDKDKAINISEIANMSHDGICSDANILVADTPVADTPITDAPIDSHKVTIDIVPDTFPTTIADTNPPDAKPDVTTATPSTIADANPSDINAELLARIAALEAENAALKAKEEARTERQRRIEEGHKKEREEMQKMLKLWEESTKYEVGKGSWMRVFGVVGDEPTEVVKARYRELTTFWHPDRNKLSIAHEMMSRLTAAWKNFQEYRKL
jgi:hypothetical protein